MKDKPIVPNHLGLILDGNRRWAKKNNLPTLEGHRKGYENLKNIALEAYDLGVNVVSAFVFSTENWNRSKEEVNYLMDLLIWVAKHEVNELNKRNVKLKVLGTHDKLSKKIINALKLAEEKTKNNTGGVLCLCLNYGGRQEIVDAVNKIIIQKSSELTSVDEFAEYLYSPDVPDVDLIIRTSGELRISNFMLWRAAYSELMFIDKNWPDFNTEDLRDALSKYAQRMRRFGK